MKRLLGLILLAGIIYGGYIYYRQSTSPGNELTSSLPPQNKLIIIQLSGKLADIAAVLGASIETTYENGKELLSNATSGKSEPIINELVNKTTERWISHAKKRRKLSTSSARYRRRNMKINQQLINLRI